MFDSRLVHVSRAHTRPRLLSYMPGFRLCVHCSVIIQRGKQPAPDLISCLGSHIEVGKHYQLITVLPASLAFFFSSDSPAKRRLSFSLFFRVIVNAASRSDPLPAAAHVSVGCVRPVLTLSVSDRQQRRSHTWQRQAWAQCWGAYAQGFSVSAPHPPNTHITANPAKPQKAMGQTTDRFPIYHCVPRFTQAIQLYQHRTATLTAILREKRFYKDATTSKKKTNTKFCRASTALYFDSFCYFAGCDGFVAVFEQSSGDLWVE